jgi:hypothetical protein
MVYNWPFSTVYSLQVKGIECKEEHTLYKEPIRPGCASPSASPSVSPLASPKAAPQVPEAPEPEPKPVQKLVRLLTLEEAEAAEAVLPQFACAVCDAVGNLHNDDGVNGRPIPRPKGSREVMLEHLANV